MKTSTLTFLSAVICAGISMWTDQPILAGVFVVGHVLFWRTHIREVKINRLLDERGIFVADYDADYELNK